MRAEGSYGACWGEEEGKEGDRALKASFVLGNNRAMMLCLEGMLTQFLHETKDLPRGEGPFYCRTKPRIEISKYIERNSMLTQALRPS